MLLLFTLLISVFYLLFHQIKSVSESCKLVFFPWWYCIVHSVLVINKLNSKCDLHIVYRRLASLAVLHPSNLSSTLIKSNHSNSPKVVCGRRLIIDSNQYKITTMCWKDSLCYSRSTHELCTAYVWSCVHMYCLYTHWINILIIWELGNECTSYSKTIVGMFNHDMLWNDLRCNE